MVYNNTDLLYRFTAQGSRSKKTQTFVPERGYYNP